MNAQIEKLIAEEVARQEREAEARRRAQEAERKRALEAQKSKIAKKQEESKSTIQKETTEDVYVASAETFNLSKNFAANKGKLPMPVTGTSTIVSNFGINKSSEWNVSINSNGIDIQAQQGADIRTIFDGEVSKVFSFPVRTRA